jgi:kynurenine formamidase
MTAPSHETIDGLPTYAELLERTDAPPGSVWGLFGAGDEIGALNLLTPERVERAARAVRRGAVFSLDFPINTFPTPSRPAAEHTVIEMAADWRDDSLDGFFLQQTTQIDGLRHVRHTEHGFYGGVDPDRVRAGDPTNGVGVWADRGIVGRGVLVDVAHHRAAQGSPLDHAAGEPITPELLDETLAAQGTELAPGDMVLLRTDYPRHLREHGSLEGAHPHAGLAQSHEMLAWLWDHRVPLVAADNFAVECIPRVEGSPLAAGDALGGGLLHPHLIALLGMVVGELWKLDDLADDCAADGVYECMLVVKPLNLVGGVGSPANATAIK